MRAADLRPGDVISSAGDVVLREPTQHDGYVAVVCRSEVNNVVHLRYWDTDYWVALHRTYGPEHKSRAWWVKAMGADGFEATLLAGHIDDHLTRDEQSDPGPIPSF